MLIKLHKYQERAFVSDKKIVVNAAGIQSGKTTVGGIFTINLASKLGQGQNLIIAAPTYKILAQATLPKFLQLTDRMGKYHKVDSVFKFYHGPMVFIRSLSDPNAMEGITDVYGIWLDEGGLVSKYAWENVEGRAAFKEAPIMVTTTPYSLNWLYQLWKDWKKGLAPEVEFLNYKSIDNPYFPLKEYERQRRKLDPVRFAMKYDGVFGKMEGLVFADIVFLKSFPLPPGTRYYAGVDWGFTNPFALTIRGVTTDGIHYRVAEYCKSGLTTDEIILACKARASIYPIELYICDPSNPGAIKAFNKAGLKAIGAQNDIIEGIDRHRALIRDQRFFVFEEENPFGNDEYNTYHYPAPSDLKIDQDEKEQLPVDKNNHSIDADRYVTMYLTNSAEKRAPINPSNNREIPTDALKRLNWLKKGGSSRRVG